MGVLHERRLRGLRPSESGAGALCYDFTLVTAKAVQILGEMLGGISLRGNIAAVVVVEQTPGEMPEWLRAL